MEEKEIVRRIEAGRALVRTGYSEEDFSDYQTDQELKKKQIRGKTLKSLSSMLDYLSW